MLKCQLKTCGRFATPTRTASGPGKSPSSPPPSPVTHRSLGLPHRGHRTGARPTQQAQRRCQLHLPLPLQLAFWGMWGDGQEETCPESSEQRTAAIPGPAAPAAPAATSAPVHNAIRTAAANLNAAILFALDMEQPVPQNTHGSLAQSLRTTSDILREVADDRAHGG